MKQNIEIPEGYEFDHVTSPILGNGGGVLSVILKKKQTKDFNWYIDEYLREDPFTTKDEISNHLFTEDIKEIKTKLRSGDYRWVPWEIKIGLFRFICKENGLDKDDILMLVTVWNTKNKLYSYAGEYIGLKVTRICSPLMKDIFNTNA